ncbi:hypothetical protein TTHERM_00122240 (macronuclear) [Tetrahymena thermophila SB210]|uniref:Uncharacterized protein n=1 Tax=Tetrahymena thermophila (strain SB210) TaxID=312017 RepID=Q22YU6_TETTS|nr:hypothetical protein TTHERM_00122240 [Tetrahymena thermophila SB210]EAR90575.2 hypothetical protein TTHERM_00122240 [Tetrahymena thermophila SB210]|eukprot:XP_001010820.2 hypothetical protein TTHERM_00122240 [Tetrahymena thermophila SB210]
MSQEREEILQKEIKSVQDKNDRISLDQKIKKLPVFQKKYIYRIETIPNQMSPRQDLKVLLSMEHPGPKNQSPDLTFPFILYNQLLLSN